MLLDRMLDSQAAPDYHVPHVDILTEEALTLVSAGYDSTAISMLLGFFYICRDQVVYGALEAELDSSLADEGSSSFKELRKLPYLVGAAHFL